MMQYQHDMQHQLVSPSWDNVAFLTFYESINLAESNDRGRGFPPPSDKLAFMAISEGFFCRKLKTENRKLS